ncbi:unnamed protein product [Allacma fusca]|uniref:Uncharacterized protein n=1 Tax=Allacma fusca TaxID=39272 RepID=A0A8J2K999_9HEXA|nr:unnamed protein product [Allacma fusca]
MKWISIVSFISLALFCIFLQTSVAQDPSTPSTPKPAVRKNCIKHPPNFKEVDLPCGGYDQPSCLKVCQQLGHRSAYCKKEVFCLCHSGDLYSC